MGMIERSIEVERATSEVWAMLEEVRQIPAYSPSTVAVTAPPSASPPSGSNSAD
jgi:hypothetical protein